MWNQKNAGRFDFIIWRSDLESHTSDVFLYKPWRQIFVPNSSPKLKIRLDQGRRKKLQRRKKQRSEKNSLCEERKVNIFDKKVFVKVIVPFLILAHTPEQIKLIFIDWLNPFQQHTSPFIRFPSFSCVVLRKEKHALICLHWPQSPPSSLINPPQIHILDVILLYFPLLPKHSEDNTENYSIRVLKNI